MNREETLKKFNTYSSLFLVLGVLDLVLIWLSFGNKDMNRSAPRRQVQLRLQP